MSSFHLTHTQISKSKHDARLILSNDPRIWDPNTTIHLTSIIQYNTCLFLFCDLLKFQYWSSMWKSVGTSGLSSRAQQDANNGNTKQPLSFSEKCAFPQAALCLFVFFSPFTSDIICNVKVIKLCAWMSFAVFGAKVFFFSLTTEWCVGSFVRVCVCYRWIHQFITHTTLTMIKDLSSKSSLYLSCFSLFFSSVIT